MGRWYLECLVKRTKERCGPYCGSSEYDRSYTTIFGLSISFLGEIEVARKEARRRYLKEKKAEPRLCQPRLVWKEDLPVL